MDGDIDAESGCFVWGTLAILYRFMTNHDCRETSSNDRNVGFFLKIIHKNGRNLGAMPQSDPGFLPTLHDALHIAEKAEKLEKAAVEEVALVVCSNGGGGGYFFTNKIYKNLTTFSQGSLATPLH